MGDDRVPIKAPKCAVRKYYYDYIYSGRWSTITVGPYVKKRLRAPDVNWFVHNLAFFRRGQNLFLDMLLQTGLGAFIRSRVAAHFSPA